MARKPLTGADLFGSETVEATNPDKSSLPNMATLRKHLQAEGQILKSDLLDITRRVTDLMKDEPNVLRV